MFGQNNDQNQQSEVTDNQNPVLANSAPPAGFFSPSAPQPPAPGQDVIPAQEDQAPPADQPKDDPSSAPMIMDDNPTSFVSPATPADDAEESKAAQDLPSDVPALPVQNDDLLSMKQAALQELQPLVNHLDQSPEEKFRTVMMMIQASDDHTKLNEAFEAAKAITDDKVRAQALLDVINEINYFTQHNGS